MVRDETREMDRPEKVVGPSEEAELCSKRDEEQGDDVCFRGVVLVAAKNFNSNNGVFGWELSN